MSTLELVNGMLRGEAFLAWLSARRVTVVGLARQTSTAARLLHGAGARVRVEPVFTSADLTREDVIVITAAAAMASPTVAAARAAGVTVLGELDLGWCATEADALAIAGGAGTSAAVRYTHAILARQGRPVLSAGGGDAELLACAPGFGGDGLVLVEPSAGQLATAQVFRPRVAVVVSPAGVRHVDALLANQTSRDCLVLDADDLEAVALARRAQASVLWCSSSGPLEHGVYIAGGRIAARLNGQVEEIGPVPSVTDGVLRAALGAVACALWVGMAPEAIGDALSSGRAAAPARLPRFLSPAARVAMREPITSMARP